MSYLAGREEEHEEAGHEAVLGQGQAETHCTKKLN